MVRIANYSFTEAHQYESAVRAANVRGFSTSRGRFDADLMQIDFERVWVQSGKESLPRSAHVDIPVERSPIFFLTGSTEPTIQNSGVDLEPGKILFWQGGSSHYQRVERASRWGAMSLTPTDLANASLTLLGRPIVSPKTTTIFTPRVETMGRLIALHAEARRLAKHEPDKIAHPEVARALENLLVESMVSCLSEANEAPRLLPSHSHLQIMKRFEELIVESAGQPLYVTEVCAKVGASERTLRRCCLEQLGMAPNRYLLLRRLHLARHELSFSYPEITTVTEIATSLGFWQLGRFAGAYRGVFGESPLETLNRSPAAYKH